jgi:diguanylate cyclase (GGDEF)-like protein
MTMARSCALMLAAGSLLSCISLVANLTPDDNRDMVLAIALMGFPTAAALWTAGAGLTPRVLGWTMIPGLIFILSYATYLGGEASNPGTCFYIPLVLYSAYYLPRRVALTHLALVAVTFAAALLALTTPAEALDRWLFVVGMAAVTGGVVAHLRERLEDQARTDWLTGIANRRGFDARMRELEGQPMGVLILDVDHFKRLNDEGGHKAGDAALCDVAEALVAVAGYENVGRIGGDEFGAVFPGFNEIETGLRALDIRALVSESDVAPTISLGIAAGDNVRDTVRLLDAADDALYAAKRGGRDRTVINASASR